MLHSSKQAARPDSKYKQACPAIHLEIAGCMQSVVNMMLYMPLTELVR
jgi:hypothetical protein